LVSGFNVGYGAGGQDSIFLSEYCSILFMRLLFCAIFVRCDFDSLMFYIRLYSIPSIWGSSTLPRFKTFR
jgi:hypothetical protein